MKTRDDRLDRRRFLKATGAGLAGIAVLHRSPGAAAAEGTVISPRRILDLNHKWLFSDKIAAGATTNEFNDAGFERVTIPHTNRIFEGELCIDHYDTRIGFREARFTPDGFFLNDKHVKLRGLNRHQIFPYVGQAMPARVQRRDALMLKHELKCHMVRTSHYPQSPHFLDACGEVGLLVLEEIPGWQHIGDASWKDLSVRFVEDMIRRDWNHPSIVLWGVRINESRDDHDFCTRTNQVAHELDDTRQTGGVRNGYSSELLEDVFTMNDFQIPLRAPNHPLYLNTDNCSMTIGRTRALW